MNQARTGVALSLLVACLVALGLPLATMAACRQADAPAPAGPRSAKPAPSIASGCEVDGGLDCPPRCADYFPADDGGFTSCGSER